MLERSSELLCFLIALAFLLIPGVLAVSRLFPSKDICERWILGSTAGLAMAVYLAFALAYVRLALFYPSWAFFYIVALAAWLTTTSPRPAIFTSIHRRTYALVIILSIVAVSRFGITFFHELPPGWDPSFHMILAKKLATTGRMIHDWEPFEHISLNYPLGSHVLVVVIAKLAHIPFHTAFKLLIPAFGVLTTALIYLLASKLTGRQEIASLSALAYGLWAVYGSIDYYRWGGLPNLVAMAFFTGSLCLLSEEQHDLKLRVVIALLFTAIAVTHHHVLLVSSFSLLMLFCFYFSRKEGEGRHLTIPYVLLLSVLAGSFHILPLAMKTSQIGATGVLRFTEALFTPGQIVGSLGTIFFVFSLIGIAVCYWTTDKGKQLPILYIVCGSLIALFVFFEYGYRIISVYIYGKSYVAVTPSRFLTDLVYFLSIFAGYGAFYLMRPFRRQAAVLLGVCLALSVTNYPIWKLLRNPTFPLERMAAFRWIERNTPPDTLVMNDDAWATYLTWRKCAQTPIPVSEPLRPTTQGTPLSESLKDHAISPEEIFPKIVAVQMIVGGPPPWPVVWRDQSGLAVVELRRGQPGRSTPAD